MSVIDPILGAIAELLTEHTIYEASHEADHVELHDPEHDTDYELVIRPLN